MKVLQEGLRFIFPLTIFLVASCSSVSKMAMRSTSDVLDKSSERTMREANWHLFKDGAPANILMIEGMSHVDPENKTLLAMLAKAYGGYGFAVHETLFLADRLGDKEDSFHQEQAIAAYSKGLEYGLAYLKLMGISTSAMYSKDGANYIAKEFNRKLGEEDMSAVFYTAQSLGGLINLQKYNVPLLSKIGAVKSMMDWVCEKDREFELGGCYLFYAIYEASRPSMLGGDLEKGKTLFLEYMEKYPLNLLARVSYLEFYVLPMMDEVAYAREREILARELGEWRKIKNAGVGGERSEDYKLHPEFNLYNAIADERFKIIEKNKDNIF